MTLWSTTTMALSALRRNRMRSLLTTLGIVIGVAAVVVMQAMGEGATAYVGQTISGLGSNMLIAQPGARRTFGPPTLGTPLFTTSDVDAVQRQALDVARVVPSNQRTLRIVGGSGNRNVNVNGVSSEYFDIRQWGASLGRVISADDNVRAASVCVLGQTVREALFPSQDPVGQEIRVHDIPCRVIGVLDPNGASAFGQDQDDIVFMPFTAFARRIQGNDRVSSIMVSATAADRIDSAKDQIESILRARRHILPGEEDDFAVRDPREVQAVLETVTGILTLLLAGVAAVSLIVGGIGIMNIMLVSVTERTREIGVRLAIGARAGDILTQFLMEATILSALGGLIGIGAGLAGAFGVAHGIGIPFVVPKLAIPLAFGVSAMIGVVFGVFPARKAARLSPLAALRYE
jgi:putative ABC transport system permease protein